MSWQSEGEGPIWVPVLNAAEVTNGIPSNLLARVAYQESRFRADIISGATCSRAGCVGLMQLNPIYFPFAGRSTSADIATAASLLRSLYNRFTDWQVALAGYNWGGGNVHHEFVVDANVYVLADLPQETQDYVIQIVTDVPVPGAYVSHTNS